MKKRIKKRIGFFKAIFTEDKDLHFNLKRDYVPSLNFIKALKDAKVQEIYSLKRLELFPEYNQIPIQLGFLIGEDNQNQEEWELKTNDLEVEYTKEFMEHLLTLEVFMYLLYQMLTMPLILDLFRAADIMLHRPILPNEWRKE